MDLAKYVIGNYGEELNDGSGLLKRNLCVGGSVMTGLSPGGVMVVAGVGSVPIATADYEGKAIVGVPHDFKLNSADMLKYEESFTFGENDYAEFRAEFLHNLVHDAMPRMVRGDVRGLGDIVYDARINNHGPLGVKDCSLLYPPLEGMVNSVRHLYEEGHADMMSLSSITPNIFALTREENEERCLEAFEKTGLKTMSIPVHNKPYQVVKDKD